MSHSPFTSFLSFANRRLGKFAKMFPNLCSWTLPKGENAQDYFTRLVVSDFLFTSDGEDIQNECIPAGYTYFGQFLSHDISFDPTSVGERQNDPESIWNYRSPAIDLDSIYGGGPLLSPFLYKADRASFQLQSILPTKGDMLFFWDFQRTEVGKMAITPDPRNDDNILVSQMAVAIKLLHNHFVLELKAQQKREDLFQKAREKTVQYYQWIILNDYLPKILKQGVLKTVLDKKAKHYRSARSFFWERWPAVFYRKGRLFQWSLFQKKTFSFCSYIPVEFSAAAFRFGHSQVANNYIFNQSLKEQPLPVMSKPGDSRIRPLVDWRFFFGELSNGNLSDKINARFSNTFKQAVFHNQGRSVKLPMLDFLRGWSLQLPSGQRIAQKLNIEPMNATQWSKLDTQFANFLGNDFEKNQFKNSTPLWYYILAEAQALEEGARLGTVGSHIVAETIVGILYSDPHSYLNCNPGWMPEKVAKDTNAGFTIIDLLKLAGVYEGAIAPELQHP
jgi:hypothetical protein